MNGQIWYGNTPATPDWLKSFGGRDHMALFPARIDPTLFTDDLAVVLTATATANVGATTIACTVTGPQMLGRYVTPTAGEIKAGSLINFNGALAVLTADALLGATSISVAPLAVAIASGTTGTYSNYGRKTVLSGKLVGRTLADAAAGNPFKPAFVGGTLAAFDEIFLTMFTIDDANQWQDVELVQVGKIATIATNYLPDFSKWDSATITWLRANYNCIIAQGG